jgi:anti-sigma factor ChrR (cupin superfamily)
VDGADAAQPWRAWARAEPADEPGGELDKGFLTVRADGTAWVPTSHAGVSVRPLSVDPARRAVTMLIRMEAGASYPPHRHAAREECFVLDGDLDVDGTPMRAGDYQVAEGASIHGWQSTREGCTLLIVSSQDDELLPA